MQTQNQCLQLLMKDGILIGTYEKDLNIDLDIARQIVEYRLAFTKGKTVPAMIFSSGIKSIDKPARDYLASEKGTAGLSATAIIARSPFSRIMGNFFLKVNETGIPVKIFSDAVRAEKWLKQFV